MLNDCTNLLLPSLKNISVLQKERLHLIDAAWCHENEVENSKKAQLECERPISDLPESKPAKESRKNVQNYFIPHVVLDTSVNPRTSMHETYRRPPDLNTEPCGYHLELEPVRRGIISGILHVVLHRRLIQGLQHLKRMLSFIRLLPNINPVNHFVTPLDNIDDVLGWVGIGRTGCSIPGKVVKDRLRVFAGYSS